MDQEWRETDLKEFFFIPIHCLFCYLRSSDERLANIFYPLLFIEFQHIPWYKNGSDRKLYKLIYTHKKLKSQIINDKKKFYPWHYTFYENVGTNWNHSHPPGSFEYLSE